MKDRLEELIINNGGEIIALDYFAPQFMPMIEFIYKDIYFSIAENDNEDWECHYRHILNDEMEIDIIEWNWELIDIVQEYLLWADNLNYEEVLAEL